MVARYFSVDTDTRQKPDEVEVSVRVTELLFSETIRVTPTGARCEASEGPTVVTVGGTFGGTGLETVRKQCLMECLRELGWPEPPEPVTITHVDPKTRTITVSGKAKR